MEESEGKGITRWLVGAQVEVMDDAFIRSLERSFSGGGGMMRAIPPFVIEPRHSCHSHLVATHLPIAFRGSDHTSIHASTCLSLVKYAELYTIYYDTR